ncbi:hypothetical protein Fmac_005656 [Flemingia macrophylla]|uniref:Uncharacterized protein n=1 Tax=Flemingia macrophylla TaxID=520843 RepID=A0ABD1N8X3_9FABA
MSPSSLRRASSPTTLPATPSSTRSTPLRLLILGRFPRAFTMDPLGYDLAKAHPKKRFEILQWLEQMEALALGLERSQMRFLCVVKTLSMEDQMEKGYRLLPRGFLDQGVHGEGVGSSGNLYNSELIEDELHDGGVGML